MSCDCVCAVRHPAREAICDGNGITTPWPAMYVRWCWPCAQTGGATPLAGEASGTAAVMPADFSEPQASPSA